MFEKLYGHEPIKSYLKKALDEKSFPSTLLFSGIDGIGKGLFAKEVAKSLLNEKGRVELESHPDLHVFHPEGKSGLYSIETIRTMIDRVYQAPFEAKAKVFILHDADRMQAASANALLKTLEEPALDTTIFLLSSASQEILPTILSRCIHLRFQPLAQEAIASILKEKGVPTHFAKLAHGSASTAILLADDIPFNQMKKIVLDLLSERQRYVELSERLEKLEELLEPLKDENPIAYHKRVDLLFATILMWVRDQHLRLIGGSCPFFPDEPSLKGEPPSLLKVQKLVEEARKGFQRHIKLSTCLERLFLALQFGQKRSG